MILLFSSVLLLPCLNCAASCAAETAEAAEPLLRPRIELNSPKLKLTLTQTVEIAAKKFPSIDRARMETQVAKHEITLARTEYLPRMDMLFQELRSSQNVTEGTILPQFLNVIPIQSGRPQNSSNYSSLFGSNTGLNFSWELVDFGRRAANVKMAKQSMSRSSANERLTELDVCSKAAAAYLRLLLQEELIIAYKVSLDRTREWSLVVHTLCDKGLRPGVDAYRADGEISLAKIALIKAERDADLANQDLAETIGLAGTVVKTVKEPLLSRPKDTRMLLSNTSKEELSRHPLAVFRQAELDVARSRLHLLDRTWYPHLWWESAFWARGSGDNSVVKPLAGGIVPKTGNWGIGLTLQFPLMQYYKVRAQKFAERSTISARQAHFNVAMQELIKEDSKAKIMLARAEEIADETPYLVIAARETQIKAKERYRAGLTNVVEVVDAERMLARAEVENAEAQLRVWEAILAIAYAHGDLKPFLNLVASAGGGK